MNQTQKDRFRSAIEVHYVLAYVLGCKYNEQMLQFVKDELDGKHPKLLERRKKQRNSNGKVHYITQEQIEKEAQ
jgi:hypothetical protein